MGVELHPYTPELGEQLCEHIASGHSLRSWCREKEMGMAVTYRWQREHPEFAEQYARAREDAADTLVDDLMEIAESEPDVQRAKLKCDTRKWVASRMKPKSYGDKIQQQVTGADGGPVKHEHALDLSNLSDAALAELMNARAPNTD